jgi:hypothetical protein
LFQKKRLVDGHDGARKFITSPEFQKINVGFNLHEGLASPGSTYWVFNRERSPWWLEIKAIGAPGRGSNLYNSSAFQNLLQSIKLIKRFQKKQFNIVKSDAKAE